MNKFFCQSGWLYRFLDRLWDLIILNILFILTCIPFVTIGASVSALYSVTMKGVRLEDSYLIHSYLTAFKKNLKKGTIIWILLTAVWIILGVDIFLIGKNNGFLVFLGGVAGTVWVLISLYVFQFQAYYENSVQNTILNAFVASIKFFPLTVQLIGIFLLPILILFLLCAFFSTYISWFCSIFIFIGFSGLAWVSSFLYRKMVDKIGNWIDQNA